MDEVDLISVNTLRFLAVDAIEKAKSGHPGMPLGAAPMAYVIWQKFLRFNPEHPLWFDRDRFVLSAGHGSALLYALLHCYGYEIDIQDLMQFRQWRSKTPGHPERGLTPGVEVTTGPLGQGFGMAVGMAIAEKHLAARFNRPGFEIIDHRTFVLLSDGDLMEGVSHEVASFAGTLRLDKLICLYDDNGVSIEGNTDITFTEDVEMRFRAYDWYVDVVEDANDLVSIEKAVANAMRSGKPSLIIVHSHIGYGSPKQDSGDVHGSPLGEEATLITKRNLGWPIDRPFYVPDGAKGNFANAIQRGKSSYKRWLELLNSYSSSYPDLAQDLQRFECCKLPEGWQSSLPEFKTDQGKISTRVASGIILNELAKRIDNLIGGSADLAPSTMTLIKHCSDFTADNVLGRNLHFGVREFGMATIINGIAIHSGLIPFGSTFLVFSDYMRPALRLSAMQKAHVIFIFTHDSIYVGEDGPTHQPIEQLMTLRTIPGLTVLRPADANETALCWKIALTSEGPVSLVLTRQAVPVLNLKKAMIDGVEKGAYIISEPETNPDIIIIATGSEVHLALEVASELKKSDILASVVSMPSWELFEKQPVGYKKKILRTDIPRIAIEAGVGTGWERYIVPEGEIISINRFGASAPGEIVYHRYGFNPQAIAQKAISLVRRFRKGESNENSNRL
ncbi:MAG: transketolase [bacterium]